MRNSYPDIVMLKSITFQTITSKTSIFYISSFQLFSWSRNSQRECPSSGRRYLKSKICKLGQNWGYTPCSQTMASNRYKITSLLWGTCGRNKRTRIAVSLSSHGDFSYISWLGYISLTWLKIICKRSVVGFSEF